MKTTILFRPTGQKEMDLVKESGWQKWPPRLPEQPIFYPVTNEAYAIQIAEEWNVNDPVNGNVGYVTKFSVNSEFLAKYPIQKVGGENHTEYWIPAEDLEELNDNIVGKIELIGEYR